MLSLEAVATLSLLGSVSGVLGCRRTYIRALAVGGSIIYFDKAGGVREAPASWTTMGALELADRGTAFATSFVIP